MNDIIDQLSNNKDWQKLHEVTAKKSTTLDSYHSSWLMLAALKNDITLVKKLIAEQANVNVQCYSDGATPLHCAAQDGYIEMVKIFLAAGAALNARLENGETPLCLAVGGNHPEVVKSLLLAKADPDMTFVDDFTALHLAVINNSSEIVKLLLAAYANPNVKTKQDITPLYYAVANKRPELVRMLLEESDVNPNLATQSVTPLFLAAQEGRQDIVEYLLKHEKTDTSIAFISTPDRLREFAKKRNVVQAMEVFLKEKNVDADGQKEISMKPVEIANIMGHDDIVKMINYRDKNIDSYVNKSAKKLDYKYGRYDENPELADVFLKYHIKEDIFNKCLEISKNCKLKDKLPDVLVNGSDIDHKDIYMVKLPVADPHTYILGHITDSIHSIGDYRGRCVMDSLTRENNGYYVLVKAEPNQPLMINDKLNPDCYILGYGYTWLNEDKDVLVIDSWVSTSAEWDEIFMSMIPAFGKQITDKLNINSILVGADNENMVAVIPEKMAEGDQSNDSLSQCLLYQNPEKISQLKENLYAKWEMLDIKPFAMTFDEFCQFIMIDKVTSIREIQNIENLFFNNQLAILDSVFNNENITALNEKSNLFRRLIFRIMTTLIKYGLFNDTYAKSIADYLNSALKFDTEKLKDNLKYLSWTENQIKELRDHGLLTEEIFEDVIANPAELPLLMNSLKELNQEGLLTKDNAKLLFKGSSYYHSIVEALKLLNQKGLLNEANREALTSDLSCAYSVAKDVVIKNKVGHKSVMRK